MSIFLTPLSTTLGRYDYRNIDDHTCDRWTSQQPGHVTCLGMTRKVELVPVVDLHPFTKTEWQRSKSMVAAGVSGVSCAGKDPGGKGKRKKKKTMNHQLNPLHSTSQQHSDVRRTINTRSSHVTSELLNDVRVTSRPTGKTSAALTLRKATNCLQDTSTNNGNNVKSVAVDVLQTPFPTSYTVTRTQHAAAAAGGGGGGVTSDGNSRAEPKHCYSLPVEMMVQGATVDPHNGHTVDPQFTADNATLDDKLYNKQSVTLDISTSRNTHPEINDKKPGLDPNTAVYRRSKTLPLIHTSPTSSRQYQHRYHHHQQQQQQPTVQTVYGIETELDVMLQRPYTGVEVHIAQQLTSTLDQLRRSRTTTAVATGLGHTVVRHYDVTPSLTPGEQRLRSGLRRSHIKPACRTTKPVDVLLGKHRLPPRTTGLFHLPKFFSFDEPEILATTEDKAKQQKGQEGHLVEGLERLERLGRSARNNAINNGSELETQLINVELLDSVDMCIRHELQQQQQQRDDEHQSLVEETTETAAANHVTPAAAALVDDDDDVFTPQSKSVDELSDVSRTLSPVQITHGTNNIPVSHTASSCSRSITDSCSSSRPSSSFQHLTTHAAAAEYMTDDVTRSPAVTSLAADEDVLRDEWHTTTTTTTTTREQLQTSNTLAATTSLDDIYFTTLFITEPEM